VWCGKKKLIIDPCVALKFFLTIEKEKRDIFMSTSINPFVNLLQDYLLVYDIILTRMNPWMCESFIQTKNANVWSSSEWEE
jgi:hypothetical protein